MRRVVPSREVYHLWAHQSQDEARSTGRGNIYFDGATIYSYGSHFPIARILDRGDQRVVLFTTRSYSATTAKHISYTRRASHHMKTFDVVRVPSAFNREEPVPQHVHDDNLKDYQERIQELVEKAARARSNRPYLLASAIELRQQALDYAEFFGQTVTIDVIPEDRLDEIKADLAKRAADMATEEKRRREAAEEKARRELADQIESFRAGRGYYSLHGLPPMLRIVGSEVETSWGARFPVRHAKRGLHLVLAVKQAGIEWDRRTSAGNPRLGHYQIDRIDREGNVTAGCHLVPFAEIERLIPQLDNNPEPAAPETEEEREVA